MAARRPKRIQRKRVKGWHMPPNTIYVGRPTAFGNPYRLEFYRFEDASGRPTKHVASAREMAVRDFRMWLGVNPQGIVTTTPKPIPMVTELVKGKTVKEALEVSNRAVAEALGGLPPIKMHCSVLAMDGLKRAIEDYRNKKAK